MQKTRSLVLVPAVVGALVVSGCTGTAIGPVGASEYTHPGDLCGEATCETATVDRVVDGDTLDVTTDLVGADGEIQRVRILGIDTPETVHPDKLPECMGDQATRTVNELAPAGTRVTLVTDTQADQSDMYDRRLAHVVIDDTDDTDDTDDIAATKSGGTNIGAELLARGLAETMSFTHSLQDHYHQLQDAAEHNNLGLWGHC